MSFLNCLFSVAICMQQNFVNNVDFCSLKFQNDFMVDRMLVET